MCLNPSIHQLSSCDPTARHLVIISSPSSTPPSSLTAIPPPAPRPERDDTPAPNIPRPQVSHSSSDKGDISVADGRFTALLRRSFLVNPSGALSRSVHGLESSDAAAVVFRERCDNPAARARVHAVNRFLGAFGGRHGRVER